MEAERCGLRTAVSSRISSMMPPSRTSVASAKPRLPPESAPTMCMRTSLEALPPSTGRSWQRITLAPLRAAAMAQGTPAGPPPATRTSQVSSCCWMMFIGKFPQR